MEDEILTVEEAADRLRCTRLTVRRMIQRGQLRAGTTGRHYRILSSEINKMLQMTKPQNEKPAAL